MADQDLDDRVGNPAGSEGFPKRRLVLLACTGLGLSIAGFQWARGVECGRMQAELDRRAVAVLVKLQSSELDRFVGVLHSIAAFYAASDRVDRTEFREFVRRAFEIPGIRALGWAARVRPGESEQLARLAAEDGYDPFEMSPWSVEGLAFSSNAWRERFPLYHFEGELDRVLPRGVDLSGSPAVADALAHGSTPGIPIPCRLELSGSTVAGPLLWVLLPTCAKPRVPPLSAGCAPQGLVLGAFDIEAPLRRLCSELGIEQAGAVLLREAPAGGNREIFSVSVEAPAPAGVVGHHRPSLSTAAEAPWPDSAGYRWILQGVSTPSRLGGFSAMAPWRVLSAGLALTGVLLAFLSVRARRLAESSRREAALRREAAGRAKAQEALRLSESRIDALLALSRMSGASAGQIVEFALEEAVRLTGSRVGFLGFVNGEESELTIQAWSRNAMNSCAMSDRPLVYSIAQAGLWAEAVRQRRPLITNDYALPHPRKRGCPAGHVEISRLMSVPVFDGDRIVVLAAMANKACDYTESDVRELTLVMEVMWKILCRARAEDALRRAHEDLETRVAERTADLVSANRLLQEEIAARERFQDELRRSEEKHRRFFEEFPVGVYVARLDGGGELLAANPALVRLFGYDSVEELMRVPEGVRHVDALDHERVVQQLRLSGAVADQELRFRRKDGTFFWGRVTARVCGEAFPGQNCFLGVIEDITDRRRAEEAGRREHRLNERLLAAIPSILIGIDGEGRITQWNRAAEHVFGRPAGEMLGQPLCGCGLSWDWSAIRAGIETCRAAGQPRELTAMRCPRPDGAERVIRMSVSPLGGSQGVWEGCLLTGIDITDRHLLETQLRQAQKLESIGQLAAGIAHEINTPTQFVGDNIRFLTDAFMDLRTLLARHDELLAQARRVPALAETVAQVEAARETADIEYLASEIPNALEQSLEGIARIARIVRAMKDFSHPGGQEKQAVDLNRAIESTVTVARNEWKYVADLELDLDPSVPPVPCLPNEFNQVVLNLIINAAHAIADVVGDGSHGKGLITVSTRRGDGWVEVRVRDTGTGIPEEIQGRIFDPFFTTKEVGRGTGQGLSIARTVVVKKHGGTIDFETGPGKGTTFIIRLPLEPAERGEPGENAGEQDACRTHEHEKADSVCG